MNLDDYLAKEKITVFGEPEYAFNNPPWTLGFMRTNEVQYLVQAIQEASGK